MLTVFSNSGPDGASTITGTVVVDQRDRPVLHLARGIAFGVDVADFLELQRAFERHRIVWAAAEVEHVARRGDEVRHRRDVVVMVERRVERGRRLLQMRDDLLLFLAGQPALGAGEVGGERREHRELAGEGLGRGDADLRARHASAGAGRPRAPSSWSAR